MKQMNLLVTPPSLMTRGRHSLCSKDPEEPSKEQVELI